MGSTSRPAGSTWPLAALGISLVATVLIALDPAMAPVAAPVAAILGCAVSFVVVLTRRRRGHVLWFEIGLVYVAIVCLYALYPLTGFLVIGQRYTPLNDLRLQQIAPDAAVVGRIAWLYVAHLLAFVLSYTMMRGRLPLSVPKPLEPGLASGVAAVALFTAIYGFSVVLGWFYDMSAASYIQSYLIARRLPLFAAQVAGHLQGAQYPLMIAILVLLFSHYPRSRPVIIAWAVVMGAVTAIRLGNRTEFMLFAFAIAITYHVMVRKISLRLISFAALAGLAGFVAFGLVRAGSAAAGGDPWYVVPFARSSEFEVLLANAVHLDRVVASGITLGLPASFYLADLAALVPQQFAPFTKFDPSVWYVTTFLPEYAAAGGGVAFGVIAESVLTGGWISAAARGALLGVIFGGIHRLYVWHGQRLWVFVFYVWVTTLSYQAFRASTLYLLAPFVYRFVVAMAAVTILAALLDAATRARRTAAASSGTRAGAPVDATTHRRHGS